jgi:23S rRNA pseudouridine1911/1915/1917 synthase
MEHCWTVSSDQANMRLDLFICAQLPTLSRSRIAKHIKANAIFVNNKPASVHHFLKTGDVVTFHDEEKQEAKDAEQLLTAPSTIPPLAILAETDDFIVINKPAGLLVHPVAGKKQPSLVDVLLAHDPALRSVGENPERPGIVHRLDKEVGGLMVIAKTQHAFEHLKRQFAEHHVDKRYLALVHGVPSQTEGDIKFRIARSTSKARMAARPSQERQGKAAWTHYRVLQAFHGAALLELRILSGRTHQIRAHLFALSHPVAGDQLYALRRTDRRIQTPRLLLQAVHLAFKDPTTEKELVYTLAPDPAFQEVINSFTTHE